VSGAGKLTQDAFLDFLPNHLNNGGDQARQMVAKHIRDQLESRMASALARYSQLPPIVVSLGPHVSFLIEARALYVHGYLYSCVAQCGITCERVLKDVAARSLRLQQDGPATSLPEAALEHLDWFEHSRVARFLAACGLITPEVRKAALDLGELRNRYAHGSGTNAEVDAFKAVSHLHTIIEGTVSLFSDLLPSPPDSAAKAAEQ
jgi:hypothetical protein